MKTYVLEGTLTALSSISHNGGDSFGINSKLRREKVIQPDGQVEQVPLLSGNGLRGMLRDRGMLHMCHMLGYGTEAEGLPLNAFHFLFSGGALTSKAGRGLDIDYARRLQRTIPLVGVFGGAVGNMIIPGKIKIGKALPICQETAHLIPATFAARATGSVWDYLQEEMYTRKDDSKDERNRPLLSASARQLVDTEQRSTSLTPVEETGQKQQMRYYVETFGAGTPFFWRITLTDVEDVEFAALLTTLVEFSRAPYVGGKSNIGLGEVAVQFQSWICIDSRVQPQSQEIDVPVNMVYHDHLRANADAIRTILEAM